jgi:predicted DCC family thiol-disulfide oxidoreductase YuxK/uncharacterized membrane protein YphA (DoxX/SURF4 family)
MRALLSAIDRWIFREYAPVVGGLPLFRIVFALLLLVYYLPRGSSIGEVPDSFFQPTASLAVFVPHLPPRWFFALTDFLSLLAAVCLLFGYRTRWASFGLAALLVAGNSFRYSFGKTDHDVLVIVTLFCLGFSDWGERHSFDAAHGVARRRGDNAWPVALLALMISLCMFTASATKAKTGWLDPRMECCRGYLVLDAAGADHPMWLADRMAHIDARWFWKAIDYSTVAIEGGFIVAMARLPAMRLICALACIFHGMIYLSMDIFFFANPAAYAALIDFRSVLRRRDARRGVRAFDRLTRRVRLIILAPAVLVLYGIETAVGPWTWQQSPLLLTISALALLVAGVVGVLVVSLRLLDHGRWGLSLPVRGGGLIMLYDGECGFCDRSVQFILRRDRYATIRFAPLQSAAGRELRRAESDPSLASVVLWVRGRFLYRSDAVAMILCQIGLPWSLLGGLLAVVPKSWRDFGYDWFAARRKRFFPRKTACEIPTSEQKSRFLH